MASSIVIIKMVILPRFLYLFLNFPIPLTNLFFLTLCGLLLKLIWAGQQPLISWDTLVPPYERGRFGVPHLQLYFLATQSQYAHYWHHADNYAPNLKWTSLHLLCLPPYFLKGSPWAPKIFKHSPPPAGHGGSSDETWWPPFLPRLP